MSNPAVADESGGRLRLSGPRLQLEISPSEGTFAICDGAWSPLPCSWGRVQVDDSAIETRGRHFALAAPREAFEDAHGRGVRALLRSEPERGLRLHAELCIYDEQAFALFRLGVENTGRTVRRVRALSPLVTTRAGGDGLTMASPARRWRWYRHGWQSWTPTLSLAAGQQDIDARPPVSAPVASPRGRGELASDEVAVLLDAATGRQLTLGFVTARHQWTQVRLSAKERALEAVAFADGAPLRPGETLWSERLLIDLGEDASRALAAYGDALAREMGARVPAEPPTGWCSWYYYFTTVSEEDVLKNLRFLADNRDRLPVRCVQIDDGYQAGIGDWTTANARFPHGMSRLAEQIHDAGFEAGIWLAPFLLGAASRTYAAHPDWAIGSDGGQPALAIRNWGQDNYGLDCTHPQVEAWLRGLFREVTDGWGYDYVKVDFLYGAALSGRRYDKNATRVEAYRRGLAAVRAGVGERFVLGCGALMGPSVGLVDAQRIGPDVAPWWRFRRPVERAAGSPRVGGEPSTENAARNVLTRAWMHGRLWANDPDCLLARATRTKLTPAEVQSLATLIALAGGALFVSDDLPQLSPERLDLLAALLPPLGEAPVVPDLLDESMPAIMEVDVSRPFESWRLVGRFNWLRRRRSLAVALPPGRWQVFEFWERRYYGVRERQMTLPGVPAHGVRLLALRRDLGRPQLIGTGFHVSMGAREVSSARWQGRSKTLRIGLEPVAKREGELFVSAPRGFRFVAAELNGDRQPASLGTNGLVAVALTVDARARLAVTFR